MLLVDAETAFADDRLLLLTLICLLKLLAELFLLFFLSLTELKEVTSLICLSFFLLKARFLQIRNVFSIHIQMLNSNLENLIKTCVDVGFNAISLEYVI